MKLFYVLRLLSYLDPARYFLTLAECVMTCRLVQAAAQHFGSTWIRTVALSGPKGHSNHRLTVTLPQELPIPATQAHKNYSTCAVRLSIDRTHLDTPELPPHLVRPILPTAKGLWPNSTDFSGVFRTAKKSGSSPEKLLIAKWLFTGAKSTTSLTYSRYAAHYATRGPRIATDRVRIVYCMRGGSDLGGNLAT